MINSHQFKDAAKKFRAGRITLAEFTDLVIDSKPTPKPNESASAKKPTSASVASGNDVQALVRRLHDRPADSHKGDFGRVLAVGGSEGMAGAISLTGLAALRSGSGLVKVAVPEMIQSLVASINPCLMSIGCAADGDGFHGANASSLTHHCLWADVVAIGPGMGQGSAQQWILHQLYPSVEVPMVVDADGLNALAACDQFDLSKHEGQRVLTPHPGEFCRLIGEKITSREKLEERAKQLAKDTQTVIVLKGKGTFVTDGESDYRNATGNPGMATAGSGDVLTGVITSFIGQGFSTYEASMLGVYLHGKAGDEAAKSVGAISLIATDIVEHLATALKA